MSNTTAIVSYFVCIECFFDFGDINMLLPLHFLLVLDTLDLVLCIVISLLQCIYLLHYDTFDDNTSAVQ